MSAAGVKGTSGVLREVPVCAPRSLHNDSRRALRPLPYDRLLLVLTMCTIAGCEMRPPVVQESELPATERAAPVDPRSTHVAQPEWERNISHVQGTRYWPFTFRAGGGLAVALHGPPLYHMKYTLSDSGRFASGGRHYPRQWEYPVPIDQPVDIVGVSSTGYGWFLDRASGRVVGEDVGGQRELIAMFGIRESVRSACAIGEDTIAFIDGARRDRVFIHDVAERRTEGVALPAGIVGDDDATWERLRFGGSPDGPCVLWAPHMRGAVIVSGLRVDTIGTFVEPIVAERVGGDTDSAAEKVPDAPAVPGAMDATSFPGGVAVLFQGGTPEGGRLVDLYSVDGEYLETMLMPRYTTRIAGYGGRLLTLSLGVDSIRSTPIVYLSSYVLPSSARALGTREAQRSAILATAP